MIPYLLALISAMLVASEPADRCLVDAKDALPESKAVICIADPLANPLDGFEPPKVAMPHLVPVTETEFNR